MQAIVEERTIATSPERVFQALTQADDIIRWWSEEAITTPEVGSLATFRFRPPAGTLQFEVAELDAGEKVRWVSRQEPPHWAGTSVTWSLTPVTQGTRVNFTHDGFVEDANVETVRQNWSHFLDSLKSYLETGKGAPGVAVVR
ncbi:MAG TPA: SRPBCC domain-containing protein [Ktedonobacterales bacterium]|nr:SRPBCC domain-containing protein [Ktedonobacterales bacterium]